MAKSRKKSDKSKPSKKFDPAKATIYVAVITLLSAITVAAITNADKLRNGPSTQDNASETENLLAFIDQRKEMVESGFDTTLRQAQEAEGQVSEQDAPAARAIAEIVKEKRDAVRHEYNQLVDAIRDKKPLQAEVHRTGINTTILQMRRAIDQRKSLVPALQKTIDDPDYFMNNQDTPTSDPFLKQFRELRKGARA